MQHAAAFLPFKQRNSSYLLIEKGAFAWYYVITARETKQITNQRRKKTMIILGIAALGIGVTSAVAGIVCAIKHW